MTDGQWRRIDDALAAALEMRPEERSAALRGALGDDADALRQAEELLAAEADADRHLRRPMPALEAGVAVGPWRLVHELGRGGMGVVWLARRADGQADMLAAIKFLEVPFVAEEARRRFAAEKRLLARLSHPNIARLLDAGIEEAGTPNFILEYVDGLPITRRAESLDVAARVRLLIQVAQAVQHAHANLVIHRDLKPANVLVTAGGEAKLLDFGIARLSEGDGAPTRTLFRALSIDYASPEQIRGEEVTTATDIYSLGLVFFEVLAGIPARRWSGRPVAACIEEAEHFRLPTAGKLHADLRAILDKATEREAARRYASAGDLAADLERFLEGRPVEARPRTALYTLLRFAGRNRLAVAGGLAAGIAIAVLAVTAIVAGWRAEASRRVADARLRQVEAAERETRQALETAEAQRGRAEAQGRLAAARQREMEEMSFSLLNETYQELGEVPGATGARARLIEKVLMRLERLRKSVGENRDLLLLIADAKGRMAEELGGSNENLGKPEMALRYMEEQVQSLETLRRQWPDDITVARRWAEARAALWQAEYRLYRNLDGKGMRDLEGTWAALLARAPADVAVLRSAGSYYFRCGTGLRLDPESQIRYFEKALALWKREETINKGGEQTWRNLALAHKYLAGTLSQHRPGPGQLEHAEKARAYDQLRLDRNPGNAQARMDLTFDLTTIGDYHMGNPNHCADVASYYRRALQVRRTLLEVEPANRWYQRSLLYPARQAAYSAWVCGDARALAADLPAFQALITSAEDRVVGQFLSGELAHLQGRAADACAAWRQASAGAQGLPNWELLPKLNERLGGCPAR